MFYQGGSTFRFCTFGVQFYVRLKGTRSNQFVASVISLATSFRLSKDPAFGEVPVCRKSLLNADFFDSLKYHSY